MSTVTYIADSADRYLIVDGQRETAEEWFETSLPGDEIEELREALIDAAGFTVTDLALAYTEADDARVFGEYNFADGSRDGIYNAIAAECESQSLTDGYADIWETLTVLEEIGGDVAKFLD